MSAGKLLAYYVPSTHWDREWYEPFQHFRYDLVEVLDEVLDTLERDERYVCFQTDGQSIVIEDYLEIRPERAEQVRRLARAGRLRLGPWYTLPDEFIVGPESLVRNLEEGLRVGRAFGNVSRVGFVCDLFGHISQLPQILRGFGIETAYVFRGVNEDTHRAVFRWQSPDGSEVVTYRFGPREGYFDYGAKVRGAWETTRPFNLEEAAQRLMRTSTSSDSGPNSTSFCCSTGATTWRSSRRHRPCWTPCGGGDPMSKCSIPVWTSFPRRC